MSGLSIMFLGGGLLPLRDDGLMKVLQGYTTVEELLRVVHE